MTNTNCSIIATISDMPELKSCPIEMTFKIIGKRWTVLIIREILKGNIQFNRFLENIEGISPKVLTERLRELERLGMIRRRICIRISNQGRIYFDRYGQRIRIDITQCCFVLDGVSV